MKNSSSGGKKTMSKRITLILTALLVLSGISANTALAIGTDYGQYTYIGEAKSSKFISTLYAEPIDDDYYKMPAFISQDECVSAYYVSGEFCFVRSANGYNRGYVKRSDLVYIGWNIGGIDQDVVVVKGGNLKTYPYQDSCNAGKVKKGDMIHVVRLLVNKYNNVWAVTSEGTYIYAGYKLKDGADMYNCDWNDLEESGNRYLGLYLN